METPGYGQNLEVTCTGDITNPTATRIVTAEEIKTRGIDQIKQGTYLQKKDSPRGIPFETGNERLKEQLVSRINEMNVDNMPKEDILKELAVILYGSK